MSEKKIIQRSDTPKTTYSLLADFQSLGIKHGDIVLVHSSLSAIGWVCGGAQTVIESLLEAVGPSGTIVMPAHSPQVSDPKDWDNPPVPESWTEVIRSEMPAFHVDYTSTLGMGVIAELFRTFPGTIRSNHPQTSFAANGQDASFITTIHTLTPQFGKKTPIGHLCKLKAKVLLLGVGFDSCSSFHMGEALRSTTPKREMGAPITKNGKREWIWFEDYDYDSYDFDKLGAAFKKTYPIQSGKIGLADSYLFSIEDAVTFAKHWLGENRFDF